MNGGTKRTLFLASIALVGVASLALGATPMGQVVSNNLSVDGTPVPRGSTLLSPTVVASSSEPGYLRLSGDYSLVLSRDSKALLETQPSGAIQLNVEAGQVAVVSADGRETLLAANSMAVLEDEEPPGIGEGVPIPDPRMQGDPDEELALCELEDATQELVETCNADPSDEDCDWKRIKVERRDLDGFLMMFPDVAPGELGSRRAAVFAENNDMGVRCRVVVIPLWGSLGAAAASVIILGNEITEDDEPISPVTPQ